MDDNQVTKEERDLLNEASDQDFLKFIHETYGKYLSGCTDASVEPLAESGNVYMIVFALTLGNIALGYKLKEKELENSKK